MKFMAALLLPRLTVPRSPTPRRPPSLECSSSNSEAAPPPGSQSLQGLLKFGLLCDLELDWAGNPWQHDAPLHYAGVSDDNAGFRWRFLHQA
jgi:hypothetical protein